MLRQLRVAERRRRVRRSDPLSGARGRRRQHRRRGQRRAPPTAAHAAARRIFIAYHSAGLLRRRSLSTKTQSRATRSVEAEQTSSSTKSKCQLQGARASGVARTFFGRPTRSKASEDAQARPKEPDAVSRWRWHIAAGMLIEAADPSAAAQRRRSSRAVLALLLARLLSSERPPWPAREGPRRGPSEQARCLLDRHRTRLSAHGHALC